MANKVHSLKIFLEFSILSLIGFGGVLPFVYNCIVIKNKWLDDKKFTEILGICQILPGANVVNMSIILGWELNGLKGSLAAFSGLLLTPVIIICLLLQFFIKNFSVFYSYKQIFFGIAIVASSLILAMSFKFIKNNYFNFFEYIIMILIILSLIILKIKLIYVISVSLIVLFLYNIFYFNKN